MKIGIIVGSMQYTEKMFEARDELIKLGHDAFVTNLATPFIGKTDEEKVFLYNPIPEIPYYKSEIEAVKPMIINGNYSLIV